MEEIKSEVKEDIKIDEDDKISAGKDKIKRWLKDRNNLIFLGILVLGIVIRLYYFNITKGQPLWWDEADYLAYAKNLAGFDVSWIVSAKHNSLYSFLFSLFAFGRGGKFRPNGPTFMVSRSLSSDRERHERARDHARDPRGARGEGGFLEGSRRHRLASARKQAGRDRVWRVGVSLRRRGSRGAGGA